MNPSQATLLLTRPEAGARRFLDALTAQTGPWGQVILAPLQQIVPRQVALGDTPATVFLFTSEHGARCAAALSDPAHRRAICVGARTAAVAQALGFQAESAAGDADALVAFVQARVSQAPLLHVHGQYSRGQVSERLVAAGHRARAVIAYDQVAAPLTPAAQARLRQPEPLVVPLFSPRSAQLFAEAVGQPRAPLVLAAISGAAGAPVAALAHGPVEIAATPDTPGLCAAILRLLDRGAIA